MESTKNKREKEGYNVVAIRGKYENGVVRDRELKALTDRRKLKQFLRKRGRESVRKERRREKKRIKCGKHTDKYLCRIKVR